MSQLKHLINIAQAADQLQVSRRTILRSIESGDLAATKLPGRTGAYVIDSTDLDDLRRRRTLTEDLDA